MKQLFVFFIVLVSFLLSGCKKEKQPPFYINATFETENTVSVNPVKVFTRNGEITDPLVILNFVTRNITQLGSPNYFIFGTSSQPLDPLLSMKITFRNDSSATVERNSVFYLPYEWETHQADFSSLNGTTLKVTERDSINSNYGTSYCQNIINSLLSFLPNGTCLLLGNLLHCRWKYYFPVIIMNNQIKIPIITRLVAGRPDPNFPNSYCITYIHEENRNIFNSEAINNFGSGDTIAIQKKEILFRKL